MRIKLTFWITIALTRLAPLPVLAEYRDGDIIFHTSQSRQSKAIQLATGSKLSHVGLILNQAGQPFVLEAAGRVKLTPLNDWIARGLNAEYQVLRLKDWANHFTADNQAALIEHSRKLLGTPYDLHFLWSDEKIYCSELVWKLYKRALSVELCRPKRFDEFDLKSQLVQTKMRERYGGHPPLAEPVVPPSLLAESSLLAPAP